MKRYGMFAGYSYEYGCSLLPDLNDYGSSRIGSYILILSGSRLLLETRLDIFRLSTKSP